MCGIAGVYLFNTKNKVDSSIIRSMSDSLMHRGPDAEGFFTNSSENIALAHRRLSIIDPSPQANQPFIINNEYSLTYNGALYNFRELIQSEHLTELKTKSDTEVLAHLLKKYGEQALTLLEGMYAFGFWNEKDKSLLLARDLFGIKPLYYYLDEDKIIFASEIKAILKYPGLDIELCSQYLDQYFTFGYISSPNTPFTKIKQLSPGNFLKIHNDKVSISSFSELSHEKFNSKSFEENLDILTKEIHKTVDLHTVCNVPFTSFLSGGYDSSAIAVPLAKSSSSFTFTSYKFENDNFDESKDATRVANKLHSTCKIINPQVPNLDSLSQIAFHNDDLICDPSLIPTFFLCQKTSEDFKMSLSADGGDELFIGYHTQIASILAYFFIFPLNWFIRLVLQFSLYFIPHSNKRYGLREKVKRFSQFIQLQFPQRHLNWRRVLFNTDKEKIYKGKISKFATNNSMIYNKDIIPNNLSFLEKIIYLDIFSYLEGDLLKKIDRMSMANSLEVRTPFLSKSFVIKALQIPTKFKFYKLKPKYILSQFLIKEIDSDIVKKKKSGFSPPLNDYFTKDEVLDFFSNIPNDHIFHKYINRDELIKHIESTRFYKENFIGIYSLLNFKYWLDHYAKYLTN